MSLIPYHAYQFLQHNLSKGGWTFSLRKWNVFVTEVTNYILYQNIIKGKVTIPFSAGFSALQTA